MASCPFIRVFLLAVLLDDRKYICQLYTQKEVVGHIGVAICHVDYLAVEISELTFWSPCIQRNSPISVSIGMLESEAEHWREKAMPRPPPGNWTFLQRLVCNNLTLKA